MSKKPYHVVAIGNAIVDVLAFADDSFVNTQQMRKGTMCLIDDARADSLYNAMGTATEVSGGSAANTLAGMSSLGAQTAFIGKVNDDELGKIFRHDLNAVGVEFTVSVALLVKLCSPLLAIALTVYVPAVAVCAPLKVTTLVSLI